jgi:hypothetical protein
MKVMVLEDDLAGYLAYVVQAHMAHAELEEIPALHGLYSAITAAKDLPRPQEVVQVDGPVKVEVDAKDLLEGLDG